VGRSKPPGAGRTAKKVRQPCDLNAYVGFSTLSLGNQEQKHP
jgi:hypothetical protein